jgi:hypothetical protein
MTRLLLFALACLAISGCELTAELRYSYEHTPGHAADVAVTLHKRTLTGNPNRE